MDGLKESLVQGMIFLENLIITCRIESVIWHLSQKSAKQTLSKPFYYSKTGKTDTEFFFVIFSH